MNIQKRLIKTVIGLFCACGVVVAFAENQAVRKTPLVIEGKKEKSPIETLEPVAVPIIEERPAPAVKPQFEEPTAILEDPESLLGIDPKGLPIRTFSK